MRARKSGNAMVEYVVVLAALMAVFLYFYTPRNIFFAAAEVRWERLVAMLAVP